MVIKMPRKLGKWLVCFLIYPFPGFIIPRRIINFIVNICIW